ncbi:MAG: bifunctional oligoribonuclease/PAP phosphatase NrnA [Desulfohalobiaceae bacterium]|nr:bifunctional oligoribonuclease/PAP phosphatase NrnA [Desulfohalobiaceae bacterium]
MTSPRTRIAEAIHQGNSFLLTAHVNPDGDALGSLAALMHLLKNLGKKAELIMPPPGAPHKFSWLDFGSQEERLRPEAVRCPASSVDAFFVLDCGNRDRVQKELQLSLDSCRILNIDHHPDNTRFGDLNWVDPGRSSVGEMIALLAVDLDIPLTGPLAEGVYLAMVSDTGFFSYSNTGPETLRLTARILESGFDLDSLNRRLQRQSSLNKIHLHGLAMSRASLYSGGKIGVIRADRAMFAQTRTTPEDFEDLINHIRGIKSVLVAVSLREEEDGVKFSLRSWGEVDVKSIAARFNGGGHINAAGGNIRAPLDQAEEQLVKAVKERIEEMNL